MYSFLYSKQFQCRNLKKNNEIYWNPGPIETKAFKSRKRYLHKKYNSNKKILKKVLSLKNNTSSHRFIISLHTTFRFNVIMTGELQHLISTRAFMYKAAALCASL